MFFSDEYKMNFDVYILRLVFVKKLFIFVERKNDFSNYY